MRKLRGAWRWAVIYAGIDVNIITHEKAMAAGLEAFGLWCWGMCWSQIHKTDGHIPRAMALSALGEQRRILRRAAVRLCTAGLWVELKCGSCRVCVASDPRPIASESRPIAVVIASESGPERVVMESECGSFRVHNYARKNQTADEIEAKRADRLERNAFNQRASRERRREPSPVTVTTLSPPVTASPLPLQLQTPLQLQSERSIGTASPPPDGPVTQVRPRRKPETPCPVSGASAGEIRDWAEFWKIPDGHGEFVGFLDHHRKGDARWRDWAAAWRTWLKNAARFGARGGFAARGAEITKQPTDHDAPWMKLPEVG